MSTSARTAEEIATTTLGPRSLPDLGPQRVGEQLPSAETTLDNGLRVVAVQSGAVPMVELRLTVPFAGADPTHPARAEVLAAALLAGTPGRDRLQVDTELATVGAELSAQVDPEHLSVDGSVLVEGLPVLFDVLADVLTAATYPDREVEGERDRLVERIEVARSQPGVLAREAML
ncbi:MAG: insulinase family protein, partial [Mycobacteriaceae bacterium]